MPHKHTQELSIIHPALNETEIELRHLFNILSVANNNRQLASVIGRLARILDNTSGTAYEVIIDGISRRPNVLNALQSAEQIATNDDSSLLADSVRYLRENLIAYRPVNITAIRA